MAKGRNTHPDLEDAVWGRLLNKKSLNPIRDVARKIIPNQGEKDEVIKMAHQYSVEIHKFITERLKEAQESLKSIQGSGDEKEIKFLEGKIHELTHFRNLLTEKFDLSNRKYY